MPNISVKRLIKKAVVMPVSCHSRGLRGRVKKKKETRMTEVLMTTAGQFPYHFSNGIFDGELLTALQKPKKNKPTIRMTTPIRNVCLMSSPFPWFILIPPDLPQTGADDHAFRMLSAYWSSGSTPGFML